MKKSGNSASEIGRCPALSPLLAFLILIAGSAFQAPHVIFSDRPIEGRIT